MFAVAVVFAVNVTAPVGLLIGPGFFSALLATLLIATATAGATDTPPPATPAFASVVISSAAVALSVRS